MEGIISPTESQKSYSPSFSLPLGENKEKRDILQKYVSNGWLSDNTLTPKDDFHPYSTSLLAERIRFMFLEKTEVEFIYSTCLKCGRRYIEDMTLVGTPNDSFGKIEFFMHSCAACES